jgi:drug/metabolite transporter (DMT)-like permease
MGISPIFVRFAEIGPFSSAFWRIALALPALWLWARLERTAEADSDTMRSARLWVILAGLLFATDLTFWHLAITETTVANATFLATLAPVWVVLGSGLILGEKVGREVFAGLALGLVGAAALIGGSWSLHPERLDGDLYGVATSIFFGAYFLAVRRARRVYGTGRTLLLSSLVSAAVLLVQAVFIEDQLWPATLAGVLALFALALVSHTGGQGLLAFALGHLPAAFSALVIFLEAVAAAGFGWLLLGESAWPRAGGGSSRHSCRASRLPGRGGAHEAARTLPGHVSMRRWRGRSPLCACRPISPPRRAGGWSFSAAESPGPIWPRRPSAITSTAIASSPSAWSASA